MILIADSGSTSTNWVLVEHGKSIQSLFTPGINPFYQTPEEIAGETANKKCKQLCLPLAQFCILELSQFFTHLIAFSSTLSKFIQKAHIVK